MPRRLCNQLCLRTPALTWTALCYITNVNQAAFTLPFTIGRWFSPFSSVRHIRRRGTTDARLSLRENLASCMSPQGSCVRVVGVECFNTLNQPPLFSPREKMNLAKMHRSQESLALDSSETFLLVPGYDDKENLWSTLTESRSSHWRSV